MVLWGTVAVAVLLGAAAAVWWVSSQYGDTVARWWTSGVVAAWHWTTDRLEDHWWLQLAAIAVVFGVGGALAYREGANLRTWRPSITTPTTYGGQAEVTGSFSRLKVRDPAGIAASWAPVYGLAYLLLAWAAWHQGARIGDLETWELFTVWWLACIGTLLCVVAPVLVARRPRQRMRQLLRRSWQQLVDLAETPHPAGQEEKFPRADVPAQLMLYALLKYDLTFLYLVRGVDRSVSVDRVGERTVTATTLTLTHAGQALLKQVEHDTGIAGSQRASTGA
jgi:hypothetical protein